ncbi:type VII secretion system-associated protein [Streptomyces sp. NBC_01803]|uniref:type VII secretion system-associated protein n=1 Tax=Streptomyces sp. NBC_01803 TaxID=2975946 RepID=UPI002DD7A7B4|nr:type VII secretion system-associated protein [Streptomyces sp. NBC_01803]WSA46336.1 type VII secretion system-associated protein [Streptomyces sp. NBC_01803]
MYSIDPYFDPGEAVPSFGIVGAWRVDTSGQLSDEFRHNPHYRPSPRSASLPEATDSVDEALQLAATGYGTDAQLRNVLLSSSVYLVPGEGAGVVAYSDDRGDFFPVYTAPRHAPERSPSLIRVAFLELLTEIPSQASVYINPGSRLSVRIPAADLRSSV